MDNLIEIKEKLDALYGEYKKKGNNLSDGKANEVVLLLAKMTGIPNSDTKSIAEQLSRFSAKICQMYFNTLTKTTKPNIIVIDDLLRDFLKTTENSKQPHHYVKRFADTIVPVVKNYQKGVFASKSISSLVAFIAKYAINSKNSMEVFRNTVNRTDGAIYLFDYSNIDNSSMKNIWEVTSVLFPDLSKAKYESLITEWGKKYGFIEENVVETIVTKEKTVKTEKLVVSNKTPTEDVSPAEQPANTKENSSEPIEETIVSVPEKESSSAVTTQKLYASLKRDMTKEQETIITAFTDMITPIGKAFESIQGEISKSREISAENVTLRARAEDLERQLSEQRSRLQEVNQSLMTAKTENDELKKQISVLESQNSELDSKLNDAYAINSRESSLEAEKIRSELKKAFTFLYEGWLEYEFSDVSEENYESLQAIIKKIFRSLERNGIDFKGNN